MEKLSKNIAEFNRIAREIDAAYHLCSLKMGLSDSERDILYILSQEAVSQSDIVNMTGISKQTINSSVQKMIKDGYLEPLKGSKREPLILTGKGLQHISNTVEKLIHIENKIFSAWSDKAQKDFIDLNKKYHEMFMKELDNL
ncbi:MAG: MarR family transcriptional regulator [Lachnospiraceae bacterium]|nr:MarR family transcriptional regulator [Lachnospiraceae bacterium]